MPCFAFFYAKFSKRIKIPLTKTVLKRYIKTIKSIKIINVKQLLAESA